MGFGRGLEDLLTPMIAHTTVVEPAAGWAHLASQIAAGDESAFDSLYLNLQPLLFHYRQQIGADGDDLFQDTIMDLYAQIQRGLLRDPERLPGYAWIIGRHKLMAVLRMRSFSRTFDRQVPESSIQGQLPNPEAAAVRHQQEEIAGRILRSLPERHREVLMRFYLDGHSAEQIQTDLQLTDAQFRLIKSRAKARFTELCQTRLGRRNTATSAA